MTGLKTFHPAIRWLWPAALLLGCGRPAETRPREAPPLREPLSVAAAANLRFAFEELETGFEQQHPNVDLEVTYGASGTFFAQLSQQAPFDIFFSADTRYPQQLVTERLAAEESSFVYARGRLVVWVPHTSPLDLETHGLAAVVDPAMRRIAIANPRLAPYGAAAEHALEELAADGQVQDRLVLGENMTQTAHFLETGAADVGIIALSLALSPQMKARGRYWEVPTEMYPPIEQAGVILGSSKNRGAAERLRAFVVGPEGRRILAMHGYSSPEE